MSVFCAGGRPPHPFLTWPPASPRALFSQPIELRVPRSGACRPGLSHLTAELPGTSAAHKLPLPRGARHSSHHSGVTSSWMTERHAVRPPPRNLLHNSWEFSGKTGINGLGGWRRSRRTPITLKSCCILLLGENTAVLERVTWGVALPGTTEDGSEGNVCVFVWLLWQALS